MGQFRGRSDIQWMMKAAQVAGQACDELIEMAKPGVSLLKLEAQANRLLQRAHSTAPFKGFNGFGHAICVSLNEEIVNGLPNREREIEDGDLVSIAVGSCLRGYHGKAARTVCVGEATPEVLRLLSGTKAVLKAVMDVSESQPFLKAVVEKIPQVAVEYDLRVVKDSGGCGIGKLLHEPPFVPNDPQLLEADMPMPLGLVITVMPMLTLGTGENEVAEDGWTLITSDGALSAHFAETMMMTESGLVTIS